MEMRDFVQSAGRAVLEMVEREWEPLCQTELEQRLDQAVEDILEADLVAKVQAQPPAVYVHLVQSADSLVIPAEPVKSAPPEEEEHLALETEVDPVDSYAVTVRGLNISLDNVINAQ